jgi:hypothetical protein
VRLVRIGPLVPGLDAELVEGGRPELPVRALSAGEPKVLP